VVLKHCCRPLEDSHQGLGGTLYLFHGKVFTVKNRTYTLDCALCNVLFVVVLHALHELTWSTQEIGPCRLEVATGVTFDFVLGLLLWLKLHHVAGDLHTQDDCWSWLLNLGKNVEIILL